MNEWEGESQRTNEGAGEEDLNGETWTTGPPDEELEGRVACCARKVSFIRFWCGRFIGGFFFNMNQVHSIQVRTRKGIYIYTL